MARWPYRLPFRRSVGEWETSSARSRASDNRNRFAPVSLILISIFILSASHSFFLSKRAQKLLKKDNSIEVHRCLSAFLILIFPIFPNFFPIYYLNEASILSFSQKKYSRHLSRTWMWMWIFAC